MGGGSEPPDITSYLFSPIKIIEKGAEITFSSL